MRIVHMNTNDILGGAARAAHRLHKGLLQSNAESTMLVRYKASSDNSVFAIAPTEATGLRAEDLDISK